MTAKNVLIFIIAVFFTSCSTRNLIYMSDLPEDVNIKTTISNLNEPTIQPLDLLSITVSTLNPESNLLFNSGVFSNMGGIGSAPATSTLINEGYRVNKEGEVNFPVLGMVKLGGLTIDEAISWLTERLEEEVRNPIVNIKFLNFRITVIGEVSQPGTIPILAEKVNIIEAIGLAGDLTPFGRRENVMIMRETEGEREIVKLDLNKSEILNSPYFYLQQNDIIYVEPVKARGVQASMGRQNLTLVLSILSVISIVAFRFF